MFLRPLSRGPAQTWWIGAGRGAHPLFMTGGELPGRLVGVGSGGHGDVLRGNCGDAAGAELGSSFVERIAVNTGTVPVCPVARGQRAGPGWARSRPAGLGRGGAAVVLRAGESPAHGEGRQRLREGKEAAMPQDAPPNGGARGPAPAGTWSRVAGMQAKLHRWAAADPGRRFDDLFNFVHDPATLIVAFDRVAGTRARTRQAQTASPLPGSKRSWACPGSWMTCGPP